MLTVKVVYALSSQTLVEFELSLEEGTKVMDALNQSGIYQLHPEIRDYPVGIFSRQVSLDTLLREGDRIEIYRPLLVDPMEKRRLRAKGTKK